MVHQTSYYVLPHTVHLENVKLKHGAVMMITETEIVFELDLISFILLF